MKLTRRTGWIRLGIVLSLTWFVFVSIYAIFEHQSAKAYYAAEVAESYNRNKNQKIPEDVRKELTKVFGPVKYFGKDTFLSSCRRVEEEQVSSTPQPDEWEKYTVKEVSCTTRWGNLFALYLVPVAVSWMLVYIVVFAVLWVRAGFRND